VNNEEVSVNPDQDVIDLDFDDTDVRIDDPPPKKQRTRNDH
jgi:hypothetical protein